VGGPTQELSALVFIAKDRGYFEQYGLDAKLFIYWSIAKPVQELKRGAEIIGSGNRTIRWARLQKMKSASSQGQF